MTTQTAFGSSLGQLETRDNVQSEYRDATRATPDVSDVDSRTIVATMFTYLVALATFGVSVITGSVPWFTLALGALVVISLLLPRPTTATITTGNNTLHRT